MTQPRPDADDVRLLTQVGFMAASVGDCARAERIFVALQRIRPDRAFPHVGVASALLNAGRASEAAARLASAAVLPGAEADMVGAFRGLALQLDERAGESSRVLHAVAFAPQAGADTPSDGKLLALRMLGEVHQSVENSDNSARLS